MPLSPGDKLGPYEILSPLGAGGMGEVWKARDTRLNREVAIKISNEKFSDRFEREAKSIAALNHPNICQLYDVGPNYLVMELIEGESPKGPLPLDRALDYARQIAAALEAAHEKGIIHRDLKPANIKITPAGIVKVLDFGLAKSTETPASDPEVSPTMTISPTRAGMILGTAAYMAPEQARGKLVDPRADIWAFGVVLYEMLNGRSPFEGGEVTEILASVMRDEPDLEGVPAEVRRLLKACLEKNPKRRLQAIADWRLLLDDAPRPQDAERGGRSWKGAIGLGAAGVVLAAFAVWSLWRTGPPGEHPVHFQVTPPPGTQLLLSSGTAISPDGRTIAFVGSTGGRIRIWTRAIDSITARELPDTDGAQYPFWSPDSRALGFFADGKLKRIDLAGSSASVIAESVSSPRGGTWSAQGNILFVRGTVGGLYVVPASGGTATPATTLDVAAHETGQRWPQFLPDGRQFTYRSFNSESNGYELYLASLDHPSKKKRLLAGSNGSWYIPASHGRPESLLWLSQESLVRSRFDPGSGKMSDPSPVAGAETVYLVSGTNYPGISASNDGAILVATGVARYDLAWFSRDGKIVGTVGQPDHFTSVRISPDAASAGVSISQPSGHRLAFTVDFARGVLTRFPSGDIALNLIWTPDGRQIVYYPLYGHDIFERSASGAGDERTILHSSRVVFADDISPDGHLLLFEQTTEDSHTNLWLQPLDRPNEPSSYLRRAFNQFNAQFSPDGRWVAYTSDESGRQQVHVQSFPASDQAKWQVSIAGGDFARWRRDGKELFYRAPDGKLMAASIRTTPRGLEFGTPVALFPIVESAGQHTYPYDVAPDGQRILTFAKGSGDSTALQVLLNQ